MRPRIVSLDPTPAETLKSVTLWKAEAEGGFVPVGLSLRVAEQGRTAVLELTTAGSPAGVSVGGSCDTGQPRMGAAVV